MGLVPSLTLRVSVVFAAALAIDLARAQDRDTAAEFKTAKSSLLQQLHDRKSPTRVAAIKKLESFASVDAAKILLLQGLTSGDEEVRTAAFQALVNLNGDKEICTLVEAHVGKQWQRPEPLPEAFAGLAVLLTSELPEVKQKATRLVQEAAGRPRVGRVLLITMADELAKRGGEGAARSLEQLMELPLFNDDFAYRRAVEQALTQARSKQAVTLLIKLLADARGEVRSDIVRYLTHVSGENRGADPTEWLAWWTAVKDKFEFPPVDKERKVAGRAAIAAGGPSYYGLPLSGGKLLFVMDTSASMNGLRILAAKRELTRAIGELPDSVDFNVLVFNRFVVPWQSRLVPATPDYKRNAAYFVELQGLGGGTASYDALEAALTFDAEAIYFVTDGAPYGGKITSPPQIVQAITRLNQFRRMTINSLGIGVDHRGSAFDTFLRTLAEQNFGQYESVDR